MPAAGNMDRVLEVTSNPGSAKGLETKTLDWASRGVLGSNWARFQGSYAHSNMPCVNCEIAPDATSGR